MSRKKESRIYSGFLFNIHPLMPSRRDYQRFSLTQSSACLIIFGFFSSETFAVFFACLSGQHPSAYTVTQPLEKKTKAPSTNSRKEVLTISLLHFTPHLNHGLIPAIIYFDNIITDFGN